MKRIFLPITLLLLVHGAYGVMSYPAAQWQLLQAIENNNAKSFQAAVEKIVQIQSEQKDALQKQYLENSKALLKEEMKERMKKSLKKELGLLPHDMQIDASAEHELDAIHRVTRRLCFSKPERKRLFGEIMARKSGFGVDGFDFFYTNDDTPLIAAIKQKRADFVQTLIKHGASVLTTDAKGNLPEDIAMLYRNQEIVDCITKAIPAKEESK